MFCSLYTNLNPVMARLNVPSDNSSLAHGSRRVTKCRKKSPFFMWVIFRGNSSNKPTLMVLIGP